MKIKTLLCKIMVAPIVLLCCWEGCFFKGGGSRKIERAFINGIVLSKAEAPPGGTPSFDSLETGLAEYYFSGMKLSSVDITNGHFKVENLTSGCCYEVIIRNGKYGDILGIDSTLELKAGENKLLFKISTLIGDTLVINPDTTVRERIMISPKH